MSITLIQFCKFLKKIEIYTYKYKHVYMYRHVCAHVYVLCMYTYISYKNIHAHKIGQKLLPFNNLAVRNEEMRVSYVLYKYVSIYF